MRILFLGNNELAVYIASWLRSQGEDIVGLVLHPKAKSKRADEIAKAAQISSDKIFEASQLDSSQALQAIQALKADIGISVLFGYVLKKNFLNIFQKGCLNLHPAWLPYNRGAYPNVWSIVENTPAGVTLHYMDEGIDTGDIAAQKRVLVEASDTGKTLYHKLERACIELFKETWPNIRSGNSSKKSQSKDAGTYHQVRDVEKIDEIDMNRSYVARELIDILRARTFPPYSGAYFVQDGKKIYLQLELKEGNG